MTVWYLVTLVAGYFLRHWDPFKFHIPPNPLAKALADAQELQQKAAQAELLAKLQAVQIPGSSGTSAGS